MPSSASTDLPLQEQVIRLLHSLESAGRAVLVRYDQDLLQSIVDAAAQIFGAAAASIALVDEAQQNLVFKVAFGAGKENVVGISVPLDHGLAGFVVMTGQPVAVSDVRGDTRFNQDFASSTGYVPRSILAMPLLIGDRVIGVMEVLDKISAPTFGMQDMDLLALFARQAAIAIHQSQQYDHLEDALMHGLNLLVGPEDSPELAHTLETASEWELEGELLNIADQFNVLSQLGSAEQRACLDILNAFGRYARAKVALY